MPLKSNFIRYFPLGLYIGFLSLFCGYIQEVISYYGDIIEFIIIIFILEEFKKNK